MQMSLLQSLTQKPPFCHREAVRGSVEALLNAKQGRVPYPFGLPDFMDSLSPHFSQHFSTMLAKHVQQFDSRIQQVLCEKMTESRALGSTSYRLMVTMHLSEKFELLVQTNWLGRFYVTL